MMEHPDGVLDTNSRSCLWSWSMPCCSVADVVCGCLTNITVCFYARLIATGTHHIKSKIQTPQRPKSKYLNSHFSFSSHPNHSFVPCHEKMLPFKIFISWLVLGLALRCWRPLRLCTTASCCWWMQDASDTATSATWPALGRSQGSSLLSSVLFTILFWKCTGKRPQPRLALLREGIACLLKWFIQDIAFSFLVVEFGRRLKKINYRNALLGWATWDAKSTPCPNCVPMLCMYRSLITCMTLQELSSTV